MTLCPKCGGTGFLPFIKAGKVITGVRVYCPDCNDPETYSETYPYALKPSDIDYNVSYDHYRMLCREHGWADPGDNYPSEPPTPQEQVIIHRHSDLSKQESDLLQQTALRAGHLQKQLAELSAKKKAAEEDHY